MKSRPPTLWWAAVIGVFIVVGAMLAALCLLVPRRPAPSTADTVIPGPGPSEDSTAVPQPASPVIGYHVGELAPLFSLPSLSGELVSLSSYRDRVVILDFWASWCVPCRLSMPSLEAMVSDLGEDVVLIGVSLDRTEAEARSYVDSREHGELVAVYGSLSAARGVADSYGVLGIPRTFVIDREGVVRFAGHPTRLSRDLVESLR